MCRASGACVLSTCHVKNTRCISTVKVLLYRLSSCAVCLDTTCQPSHLPRVHCHKGMVCQRGGAYIKIYAKNMYIYIHIYTYIRNTYKYKYIKIYIYTDIATDIDIDIDVDIDAGRDSDRDTDRDRDRDRNMTLSIPQPPNLRALGDGTQLGIPLPSQLHVFQIRRLFERDDWV